MDRTQNLRPSPFNDGADLIIRLFGARSDFFFGPNGSGGLSVLGPDGSFQTLGSNTGVIIFDDISLSLAEALADADVDLLGTPQGDTLDGVGVEGAIFGLDGDDTIIAGTQTETIDGGAGNDTADLSNLTEGVVFFMDGVGFVFGQSELRRAPGFENVIGTDFRDEISGTNGVNIIETGAGNDAITATAGEDILRAGVDDDFINIRTQLTAGAILDGGAGFDVLSGFSASENIDLRGVTLQGFEEFASGFRELRFTFDASQFTQFQSIELNADTQIDIHLDGTDAFDLSGTIVETSAAGLSGPSRELNTVIFADAQDQTITGSGRAETVVFNGLRADFTVQIIDEAQTLVTDAGGNEHILNDIEVLLFDDETLDIGTTNAPPEVTFIAESLTVSLDDVITVDLSQAVTDPEGDALTFELLRIGLNGGEGESASNLEAISVDENGILTLDLSELPEFNQVGRSDFFMSFTVSDGNTQIGTFGLVDLLVLGDPINGSIGSDEIAPGDTFDGVTVDGNDGLDDTIFARQGNDLVDGGLGNDVIFGDDGRDFLFGGDGDDILFGGVGNDTLEGVGGSDELTGGSDADIFLFRQSNLDGQDTITDFTPGEDKIDVSALIGSNDFVDIVEFGRDKDGRFTSFVEDSSQNRGNGSSGRLQIEVFEFDNGIDTSLELGFSMQAPVVGPAPDFTPFQLTLEGMTAVELSLDDFIF